jgi:hypothetical protein
MQIGVLEDVILRTLWGVTCLHAVYSGVTLGLSPCAIPKDSAHIVANFDTLPSARKLLFIHEILGTKSLLCPQHVYQISKLEY